MSLPRRLLSFAVTFGFIAALTIGLTSCGSDSPTQPAAPLSQEESDDVAQQVAEVTIASNFGSYSISGGAYAGGATPTFASQHRTGPFAAMAWDTTFDRGSLHHSYHFTFWTFAGIELDNFNPVTTWRVNETSNVSGSIVLPAFQSAFAHTGALEVLGTRATDDTLRFTGTAHDTAYSQFTARYRAVTRHSHLDLVRTINDVQVLKTGGYPLSGSVTWVVQATLLRSSARGDVEKVVNTTATLTFDGTRYPTLEVGRGLSYTLDLETGIITRVAV